MRRQRRYTYDTSDESAESAQPEPRSVEPPPVSKRDSEPPPPDPYLAAPDPDFVMQELRRVAAQPDVAQSTKIRALELLMRYFGMLEDKIHVSVEALTPAQRAEKVTLLLKKAQDRLGQGADAAGDATDRPTRPPDATDDGV